MVIPINDRDLVDCHYVSREGREMFPFRYCQALHGAYCVLSWNSGRASVNTPGYIWDCCH